jgi:hypothetical protein
MKQFLIGFIVASFFWIFILFASGEGWVKIFGGQQSQPPVLTRADTDTTDINTKPAKIQKRRRGSSKKNKNNFNPGPGYDKGSGISGDNLKAGSREVAAGAAGAEEQLSGRQIDAGIDRVFNGIQRCLMLMPPDAPSRGKIIIGMYITSAGNVTKVNLKGPNSMVKKECGACIRRMVKTIKYPSFNGPDMTVHYPVIFD